MLLNFHSLLLNTFVYERIKRINAKKRKREKEEGLIRKKRTKRKN